MNRTDFSIKNEREHRIHRIICSLLGAGSSLNYNPDFLEDAVLGVSIYAACSLFLCSYFHLNISRSVISAV